MLKKIFVLLILNIININICSANSNIKTEISDLVQKYFPRSAVGIVIQDANSGEMLFNQRSEELLTPASALKLFSAAAALKKLGPDFRYNTVVKSYNQDLVVEFSGDPSLTKKDLENLFVNLKNKHIKGNIVLDDTVFEGPMFGNGWSVESTAWSYSAPISAMILDGNQISAVLFPKKTLGELVDVKLQGDFAGNLLSSEIATVTMEESETKCQIEVTSNSKNQIALQGCWPIGTEPVNLRLALNSPYDYIEKVIVNILSKHNIVLDGKIIRSRAQTNSKSSGTKIPESKILATHQSKPLSIFLEKVLADSNNLYTESITKRLAAELYGRGSFKTGVLAIEQVLGSVTGIDFQALKILDGSGLSRYNLVSAQQLSRLLYAMYNDQDQELKKHFIKNLAMAGSRGTLKSRLGSFDTKDHVQAKTGSLTGVSAMAGYLAAKNRNLIVVIIANNFLESNSRVKKFEDRLFYLLS